MKFELLVLLLSVYLFAKVDGFSLKQTAALDRVFIDEFGRERIFHGVNTVVKGPPYVPFIDSFNQYYSLSKEDFTILNNAGMNVIRLGVMWPGVEPSKGQYNETYLDQIEKIVELGAAQGVYTLFDMHQDVLAEAFCGEGIPLWASVFAAHPVFSFPGPVAAAFNSSQFENSTGYTLPTKQACNTLSWATYQFAAASNVAYEALYTDTELLGRWAAMWAHVAQRFKGNKNVLGIEILNEPWAGNVLADPLLLIPGVADKQRLQPAYDVVSAAIRAVDPEVLIFFAGVTWDNFGAGFTQPPGGSNFSSTSVFAFHYYEPPQFKNSSTFDFGLHVADARRLQTGRMLTEFGSPGYNGDFETNAQHADALQLSWIMWEWKDFCYEDNATLASPSQFAAYGACKTGYGGMGWTDGVPDSVLIKKLSRPYPQAVAGSINEYSFDADNIVFSLSYNVSLSLGSLSSSIFLSPLYFGTAVSVSVVPPAAASWSYDPTTSTLTLTNTKTEENDNEKVAITVKRAGAEVEVDVE